ncbi:MAG: phage prohead protease family protein [Frankiales bacterium]|nr:phage prohead protease family protein [Frankiales bacterium]
MRRGAIGQERRAAAMPDAAVTEGRTFSGTAVVFDTWAMIGAPEWGFRERVTEGALTKTLRESDVLFLDSHDSHKIISRTSADTLKLTPSSTGLAVESDMDTRVSYVSDVIANVENGNYKGMSFGFRVTKDDWASGSDGIDERTIREMELFEVSAVANPAYTSTDAAVRSAVLTAKIQRGDLTESEVRMIRGTAVADADQTMRAMRRIIEKRLTANDTFASLNEAVQDAYSGANGSAYVEDYDDTFVYFTVYDWTDNDSDTYRQGYTLAADGMATLTGTSEQVRRRSTYAPVTDPDDSGEPADATRSSDMTEPPHGTRAEVALLKLRMQGLKALHNF